MIRHLETFYLLVETLEAADSPLAPASRLFRDVFATLDRIGRDCPTGEVKQIEAMRHLDSTYDLVPLAFALTISVGMSIAMHFWRRRIEDQWRRDRSTSLSRFENPTIWIVLQSSIPGTALVFWDCTRNGSQEKGGIPSGE
jgi:hypothetical protein